MALVISLKRKKWLISSKAEMSTISLNNNDPTLGRGACEGLCCGERSGGRKDYIKYFLETKIDWDHSKGTCHLLS